MLVSCKYCTKAHKRGYVCENKPKDKRIKDNDNVIHRFRSTFLWQKKRRQIKERDKYLCMACLHLMDGTINQYTFDSLEVHHIIPIYKSWAMRLDDSNLITLCTMHHSMADNSLLDNDKLFDIAINNNDGAWQ